MSSETKHDLKRAEPAIARDAPGPTQNLVRILFLHHSVACVQRCLHELEKVRLKVSSDVALTSEQFAERLGSRCFDLILVEYLSHSWRDTQVLDLLRQLKKDIPLIFLAHGLKRETAAEFILNGASDCVEVDNLGHLPIAAHRALKEKALRDQRDRAEKNLRHSEARYRALAENLGYGICQCSIDGRFLEVNDAMINMLGLGSREELLALDLASNVIQDPDQRAQLLGRTVADALVGPLEIE
jgi:PAS domain-containing protein